MMGKASLFTGKMMYLSFFTLFALLNLNQLFGQFQCLTPSGDHYIYVNNSDNLLNTDNLVFKVYIHVINRGNGQDGQSPEDVEATKSILDEAFNPGGIYFYYDCEIDTINSDDYFASPQFSIFNVNSHTDGIDMYLFPDDNSSEPAGNGWANGIVSTAFWVFGNEIEEPMIPLTRSPVVPHEMGHCLGLYHTFEGFGDNDPNTEFCPELVSGTNCGSCGDLVCDTPADAPGLLNTTFPACVYEGSAEDPAGFPLMPDIGNIMSTYHPSCRDTFTEGQFIRMKDITDDSSILQQCLITDVLIHPFIAQNTSEVWNVSEFTDATSVRVIGDIVVDQQATLRIEAGVQLLMGKHNKVIVRPGGELILEGTLTSACTEWQGIEIWGDNTQSQYSINGVRAQGRIQGRSGAIIENAKTAVKLYGPNYDDSGGQITCNGTTFLNNSTAIEFAPYQNYWPFSTPQQDQPRNYFANLLDCTFLTNNDFNQSDPFNTFIEMTAVNGVKIEGSDFTNEQTSGAFTSIFDYGYGIRAFDAGFRLAARCVSSTPPCDNYDDRSTFDGLGIGVEVTNTGSAYPYIIRQTDFENCYFGLLNSGVSNATILFNDFKLGQVPDEQILDQQAGAVLTTALAGFTFQENSFTSPSIGTLETIGTICVGIGEFNNEIRRNTYDNLHFGNVAEGDNVDPNDNTRGLTYLCNDNTNVKAGSGRDFAVTGVSYNRIRENQGIPQPQGSQIVYRAAGNVFSYTGIDFDNFDGEDLTYHYFNGGTNEEPLAYSGSFLPEEAAFENTCPEEYCEPPCKDTGELAAEKDKFYEDQSKEQTASAEQAAAEAAGNSNLAETKAAEASYYKQRTDQEAYMVLVHVLYDTLNFNEDTLAVWVENMDLFSLDMIWALRQQSNGKFAEAEAALARAAKRENLSPQNRADLSDMPLLMAILKGKKAYEVSNRYFKALEHLTSNPRSLTGNIAKNILRQHSYHFLPVYHLPGDQKKVPAITASKSNTSAAEVDIYPNPNDGSFRFNWQPATENVATARLEIRSLAGQIIFSHNVVANNSLAVELENQPPGIYYYQLSVLGEAPILGKFILQ